MAFADTHGSIDRGMSIARRAREADVHAVVCAGDFSQFGALWEEGIAPLVFSERKLLTVPGNHEPAGLMDRVVETFPWVVDLDGGQLALGPFTFVGFGATGLDRDGWEPEATLEALELPPRAILVTHVPPDRAGRTERALLAFIERTEPELVIAGHVHRDEGRRYTIGPTRVACVGARGALLEVPL